MEAKKEDNETYRETSKHYYVGAKTELGYTITEVYIRNDNYVIYEIKTKDISQSLRITFFENSEKKCDERLIKKFTQIYDDFVKITKVLYKSSNPALIKSQTARLVALALDCADTKDAENKLAMLYSGINRKYKEQFKQRLQYILITGCITFLLIGLSIFAYWCNCCCPNEIKNLLFISTAGSIGGFISVSIGVRKINFFEEDFEENISKKEEISKWYFFIYGLERVFISICSAVIIYVAIKTNLIFGVVEEAGSNVFAYITFGFAAGFSETFTPSLLESVEKKKAKEE